MARKTAVFFVLLFLVVNIKSADTTPNILLIVADDLGFNDLSSYGSPTIDTPNIDSIGKNGARFTEFYLGASICSPSRSSMLTGRLPVRSGVYTAFDYPLDSLFRVFYPTSVGCLPKEEVTVGDALRNTYSTAMIGKWHLGHNVDNDCLPGKGNQGFDFFYGLPYSHEEGYPGPFPEGLVFPPVPLMTNGYHFVEQPYNGSDLTSRYTALAEDLIASFGAAQNKHKFNLKTAIDANTGSEVTASAEKATSDAIDFSKPFFLHVAYENPHVPLFLSDNFPEGVSRRGLYGDSVQEMDMSIGRILSALESSGIADNTLVVFLSDNGAWVNPNNGLNSNRPTKGMGPYDGGSNAPFFEGKGSTWEGGFRSPLLMSLPGRIPSDQVIRTPVTAMDLFPTFLEYAETPLPQGVALDGVSIKALLETPVARGDRAARQKSQRGALDKSYEALRATGDKQAAMGVLDAALGDDLHKCVYFWREHSLYAIRCGQYKAHFITRSGFNFSDPGTAHDPPLLFNVDWDPAEAIPMNTSDPKYRLQAEYLQTQARIHIASVVKGPSQYLAQNYSRVPCCPRGHNDTDQMDKEVYLQLSSEQYGELQKMGWSVAKGASFTPYFGEAGRQNLRVADSNTNSAAAFGVSVANGVAGEAVIIRGEVGMPWEQCVCRRLFDSAGAGGV